MHLIALHIVVKTVKKEVVDMRNKKGINTKYKVCE